MNILKGLSLIVVMALATSCGETSAGSGDLQMSLAANEAVRVGFPHTENGTLLEFVDGWTVTMETFAVHVEQIELLEATPEGEGPMVAMWDQARILDVAGTPTGETEITTLEGVEEGRHDVRFRITPPASSGGADDTDVAGTMRQNGWSVLVRGTATPDPGHPEFESPISFDFGFSLNAEYYSCVSGTDGTQGVVVAANRQNEAYIYPHAVHLFWDTLGAGNEELRFNAMARAATEGNVTLDDLDSVDLTDPSLAGENGVPFYDDAGLLDTYTLGAFVRRNLAESIHFNGIGFCKKRLLR